MLTLSKVVVEVGNRADAARAGDYRLELEAAPEAFARSSYQLAEQSIKRGSERGSSSLWLGAEDALAQFGVRRGQAIDRDHLISVLQGQHVQTGEQLRRPGTLKREARDEHGKTLQDDEGRTVAERVTGVAHVEMTMSVPKSVSVLWAVANEHDRQAIETTVLEAAERTVQYMAQNKAVVHRRGTDGVRIREPAAGAAVASSLHVTARRARGDRAPAPQLHVHNLVAGVVRTDGQLVAADSWEWFRHDAALEGGALFRVQVADQLVQAGWAIRSCTGHRGRYFEVDGVPEALCEVMSPRSREVAEARAKVEQELGVRLQGGALAVLAKDTRQAKGHELDPEKLQQVWDALGQEHGFGPGSGTRLRRNDAKILQGEAPAAETQQVVLAQLRDQGPTVTSARARALVFEAAAGRLSAEQASVLLARLGHSSGELVALEGGRVTSREIRHLERYVLATAIHAAGNTGDEDTVAPSREAGLRAAAAALGDGKRLDSEQLHAFDLLTASPGWVCLTGRAGTGKGPTLHAAAEAYRTAGWQVIACAMDGTTARRMADQLGGTTSALTVEQLRARLQAGAIQISGRTVIFVDEASKLDTGQWATLAGVVDQHGARVRAVGHDGQHDAIRLPGLFSEMLREPQIPTAELHEIRRHRDPHNPGLAHPWLREYQVAVDDGRGADAVAILQEQHALKLYDTRGQAMGGLVNEWNSWRRDYRTTESALIVHGPNPDVDLVNELAQQQRLDADELGHQAVRAVDRDYLLHPGDVVAVRKAAYAFPAQPGRPRPNRVENGQTAIVEAVDPARDTITLMLNEPGTQPRLVEIDQAKLRAEHAAGKRAAAVRLNYAMHSFPAQGATVRGTATLAGHWSQAKQETYVGDTRAIYRHTVHIARADLGTDGTDEDRVNRYAQRISENRQRHASIHWQPDPGAKLAVRIPDHRTLPSTAAAQSSHPGAADTLPLTSTEKRNARHIATAASAADPAPAASNIDQHRVQLVRSGKDPTAVLDGPPEPVLHAPGAPAARIAHERWTRQARRLEALNVYGDAGQQPAPTPPNTPVTRQDPGPRPPTQPQIRPSGPAVGR